MIKHLTLDSAIDPVLRLIKCRVHTYRSYIDRKRQNPLQGLVPLPNHARHGGYVMHAPRDRLRPQRDAVIQRPDNRLPARLRKSGSQLRRTREHEKRDTPTKSGPDARSPRR
jgi:hypothetical protein